MMGVVPTKNLGPGKTKQAQTPKKDNAKKKNPVKGKETNEESGAAPGYTRLFISILCLSQDSSSWHCPFWASAPALFYPAPDFSLELLP